MTITKLGTKSELEAKLQKAKELEKREADFKASQAVHYARLRSKAPASNRSK